MVGLIDWSLLPVQLFHDFCHFSDMRWTLNKGTSGKLSSSAMHCERRKVTVEARIQYKRCVLVHLALARKAPTYITSLLQPITACPRSMVLRSATADELFTPRSTLKFGERAFRISAPKAWNCLPHDIRLEACTNSFKWKLKTFLFEQYYYIRLMHII